MSQLQHWVMRAPIRLYRLRLGRLLTRRMLLLTHTGRRSGRSRQTVLEAIETRGYDPVIVSGFGRTADWFRNVEEHPEVDVDWAGDRFTGIARILDAVEAAETFGRYLRDHPKAAATLTRRLGVPLDCDPSIVAERLPVLVLRR